MYNCVGVMDGSVDKRRMNLEKTIFIITDSSTIFQKDNMTIFLYRFIPNFIIIAPAIH
jgi:hypothetical protein